MKAYIREHKKFIITVIVLLILIMSSSLYLLINKKYESTFSTNDIINNTFKYTITEESGKTINSIKFIDNMNGKRIFKLNDENTKIDFTYTIDNDSINIYINGITTTYKYINDCIYDITVPEILYCK